MKDKVNFKDFYKRIGTHLLTTLLILFFINFICFIYLKISDKRSYSDSFSKINFEAYINKDYEIAVDSQYVIDVLKDYHNYISEENSKLLYHPSFEYSTKPYHSKHINIIKVENEFNQRQTLIIDNSKKADSIKTIYCFGGSTTNGWLVSDEHSWPSLLMKILKTNANHSFVIKNFAVPAYSATQETNQFIELLKLGHRPSLCIFMDGLNTGPVWDGSELSKELSNIFSNYDNTNYLLYSISKKIPINRVFSKLFENENDKIKTDSILFPVYYSDKYNTYIANRFIENARIRQAIAKQYGIKIIQFLQPNVFVNYDEAYLSGEMKTYYNNAKFQRKNYPEIYKQVLTSDAGYIDFSLLFKSYHYPAIIDECHYSPNFNLFIAKNIQKYIQTDELQNYHLEKNQATGFYFNP